MAVYSETDAQQAVEDIKKIVGDIPMAIQYELQDGGEFLLLNIDFTEQPTETQVKAWYKTLKEYFSKAFPKPIEGYSWMINIMHKRYILDSVMDEIAIH
jgi:hypothetical protein